MHQGEPGDRVLILLRGHVKATFVEPDGKEIVLSFRDPGDVLGELSFARSEPRSSNVVAIEPVGALAYGEAVLRESMRLKPVVPFTGFKPPQEVTIAGVRIPADTDVMVMLRHAGLYESGVERALDFEPERWLEDGQRRAPGQKSFLAFGAGPRFCPGRNLAFLEAKAGMAAIARNLEIELDESNGPATERLNFVMVPRNLRVRLRSRHPAPAGAPA